MAFTTKVTIEQLLNAVGSGYDDVVTAKWNGLKFEIKPQLTLEETIRFANDVTELCFSENTEAYMPEVKEFAIRLSVLKYYTNCDFEIGLSDAYKLVYFPDLISTILEHVDADQYYHILESIDNRLEYRTNCNIGYAMSQLNKVMDDFEKVGDKLNETFEGVNADDLNTMMELVSTSNGVFDENKFVEGYMEKKEEKEVETDG